jgi:hypothetical protein
MLDAELSGYVVGLLLLKNLHLLHALVRKVNINDHLWLSDLCRFEWSELYG